MSYSKEETFMGYCIALAQKGEGYVSPNPLVGSLLVYENKIIGEGFHEKIGGNHAEVNAIESCDDLELIPQSTLYVNLEPCCHFGKTPPCVNRIVDEGIKNVVVGQLDPDERMQGKGIALLEDAGVTVKHGVLVSECRTLNRKFNSYNEHKRPFIILKWAQSNDGFFGQEGKNIWHTNQVSKMMSHKLRQQNDAILVGTNTYRVDQPSLTNRLWYGESPKRFVLDFKDELSIEQSLETPFIKLSSQPHSSEHNWQIKNAEHWIQEFVHLLYENGIQSIIIEGGKNTLEQFISRNLWDEAHLFTGQNMLGEGIMAPFIYGETLSTSNLAGDGYQIIKNQ